MKYLTVEAAAQVVHCHPDTIRRALRSHELDGSQRVKGGTWRVTEDALDKWVLG